MLRIFINAEYDEGLAYEGKLKFEFIEIYLEEEDGVKTRRIFDSGDVIKDWFNTMEFVVHKIEEYDNKGITTHTGMSSSVDHLMLDLPKEEYQIASLLVDESGANLIYERNIDDMAWVDKHKGLEFISKDNMTWDELKKYCGYVNKADRK